MDEPLIDDGAFDDGGLDPADVDFDHRMRDRLTATSAGQPERVLAELRPRIVRAGRIRRAQMAAAVVGPVAAVIVGLVLLPGLSSQTDRQATVAGEPDASQVSADPEPDDRPTVRVTGTTEAEPEDRSNPTAPSDDEPGSNSSTTTPTESTDVTADPETTPPSSSPTTAGSGGPTDTATSTSRPGSVLVESSCGSIVVIVVDSSVELIETRPDDGYQVDVKSSGPEVEVSLEGGPDHCELKAEYERGRLVTSGDDENS